MGNIVFPGVTIHPTAEFDVEHLEIGHGSIINAHVKIEGRRVVIGRDAWINEYALIGGGSCFEETAYLKAGDFLHVGRFAHINTAAGVDIGDEVGVGYQTNIWTHGAYPPIDIGFPTQFAPVAIGSWAWLPHAWVNPGVKIGQSVVVAAMSLVNKSLPPGCLAGGVPAKILEKNAYPKDAVFDFTKFDAHLRRFFDRFTREKDRYRVGDTEFDIYFRCIAGPVTEDTEIFKNLLRRSGIRFRFSDGGGEYVEWE
ncbi:MAG: acyltransferase [Planctomycetota bacterium]|jgi:acetyltransferase-like isoleucine patch superfamily enzyme